MTLIIITNVLISIAIYFCIATVLIIIDGKPKSPDSNQNKLSFDELAIDYSSIPSTKPYQCRDGALLNHRYYPSNSDTVLVLLHGSGWHSQYFLPLAEYISSENIAHVYTPDLRGHGKNPIKRGDISYINQLVDDIADFVETIRKAHPHSKLIISGHSSGGGLAVRFAGSKYGKEADAYLLLSPYLKYNAPTMKLDSGGWASAHMPRIVGLSMLNNAKIPWFNYLPVIDFNMPETYRDGTETLSYSFRLNTGYAPSNYKKDFISIKQKVLVLVGKADESFIPENFLPELSKYKEDVEVNLLENTTHMGIVTGDKIRLVLEEWIAGIESHEKN